LGKNFYKIVFIFIFTLAVIFVGTAQDKITLSQSSVVSMITIYEGDQIYSLFGHSAFRVYDPENGIDLMYNYGTFNFSDGFFVLKFIEGKLDYYLDIDPFQRALRYYVIIEGRKVFEQVLDLDLKQRQALFDFLEENGKPENRVYRYDFIWDNCSTRIADAIDRVFPGLVDYSAYKGVDRTYGSFRKMIMSYLDETPFANFGIQLVLGSLTDRTPEGHELFFLPLYMKEAFSKAVIKTENGTIPLVLREAMIASPERDSNKKPDYPFFIFMSVLVIYFVSLVLQYKKNIFPNKNSVILKLPGIASALCEAFVFLFAGTLGLLITYLWFFSEHTVTALNFNYLWCTPLNLILFAGMFLKRKSSFRRYLFLSVRALSLVMCVVYLICIAAGVQYALPAFFPIVLFLIAAGVRKYIEENTWLRWFGKA